MKLRAYAFLLFLSGTAGLFLQGCKEDTIIDGNLIPAGDEINTSATDTITILSKTFFDDTLVTSLSLSGVSINHALGNISAAADPYSGNITAGIYVQVVPPTTSFTFSKAPDSAVLVLPYSGFSWGDTTAMGLSQTFEVYEIADTTLSLDTLYYTNSDRALKPGLIGTATIANQDAITDSVSINGSNKAPHLRIRLSDDYLNRVKAAAVAGGASFTSYAAFLKSFPGFYITPKAGNVGNTLYYFKLDGSDDYSRANVQFYYTDTATVKSNSFFFTPQYAVHYNRIKRDRDNNAVTTLYNSTAATDSVFVIHNEPGGVADLRFPFIKSLPKAPINKAELIITQIEPVGDAAQRLLYTPPARLFPIGVNDDGSTYTILDRFPTSSTEPLIFIDGSRGTETINGKTVSRYVINIPREVQKAIVEGKDVLHLRVSGASGFPGAYRLIAGGSTYSDPAFRIKLRIVYSKI